MLPTEMPLNRKCWERTIQVEEGYNVKHAQTFKLLFKGLDKSPKYIYGSMSAAVSPDLTAESGVVVNGGFDPCQYEVCINHSVSHLVTITLGLNCRNWLITSYTVSRPLVHVGLVTVSLQAPLGLVGRVGFGR